MTLAGPGCGKTEEFTRCVEADLASGRDPGAIGFLSFTRAARDEVLARVRDRLGLAPETLPWFRTIHSACLRLLRLQRPRFLDDARWRQFGERHGYTFSRLRGGAPVDLEDAPPFFARASEDDGLRYVYQWARNRGVAPLQARDAAPIAVDRGRYEAFLERLEQFRREQGVLDFADLLDGVVGAGMSPPIDVMFVDEAQDLSPAQVAVIELWAGRCDEVHIAGDDDQAVFVHAGADPSWLVRMAREHEVQVLPQSHRVPVAAHAYAERIIRQNRDRVPKPYGPAAVVGAVRELDQDAAVRAIDGSVETLVLARNRVFLRPFAEALRDRAVPFVVDGWGAYSPLGDADLCAAIGVLLHLRSSANASVKASDLSRLLKFVPTSSGLLPRGVKAEVERMRRGSRVLDAAALRDELGLGALLDGVAGEQPLDVLRQVPVRHRAYLQALVDRFGALPEARVRLTSIHGAKGRQAELVVLIPSMTRATYQEYRCGDARAREAENRIFYVAVTRTARELVVVRPRGRRRFDLPPVPSEGRLG